MLLTEPAFVISAKVGIQENEGFLGPGFHRGDASGARERRGHDSGNPAGALAGTKNLCLHQIVMNPVDGHLVLVQP
jgi:hypothetical protein